MSNFILVGTYTKKEDHVDGKGEGIYTIELNHEGEMSLKSCTKNAGVNPTFLTISQDKNYVYVVNECADQTEEYEATGYLSSFKLDRDTGKLRFLNKQQSGGAYPCHVSLNKINNFVLVSNYGGGSLSLFSIKSNGLIDKISHLVRLKGGSMVIADRQEGPHCHCSFWHSSNYLVSMDLGSDKLMQYAFDEKSKKLRSSDCPFISVEPGSGPRHVTFHNNGKFAYIINELSNTVAVYAIDSLSKLFSTEAIQTISILPDDFRGENKASEIRISLCENFLFCSNRGHDSIASLRISADSGRLQLIGFTSTKGKCPRNFTLLNDLIIVANQDTHNIVIFKVDPDTGDLQETKHEIIIPSPVCLVVV